MNIEKYVKRIKDAVSEAGLKGCTVGVSGGVDSAVVVALCKRAFPENTIGISMPEKSTPKINSTLRAMDLCNNIDVLLVTCPLDLIIKDIPFYSVCEHHLIPFIGKAHVAYIPNINGEIAGLSKITRMFDIVAKRPQVQERLTTIVADTLMNRLGARAVMVIVEAEHLCMSMRGVKKPKTLTVTSAVRGLFRKNAASRAEAIALIKDGI